MRRKTNGCEIRPQCVWENNSFIVWKITQTRLYSIQIAEEHLIHYATVLHDGDVWWSDKNLRRFGSCYYLRVHSSFRILSTVYCVTPLHTATFTVTDLASNFQKSH